MKQSSVETSDDQPLDHDRSGSADAFEHLVRDQCGRLLAVARRILRHEEDAHEAVQDAFLAAFKALERFEGNSQLSTWLHRITLNCALTKLRSRQRRPELAIDALLPTFLDDGHQVNPAVDWTGGTDHPVIRAETRAAVREAIDRLPDSYRVVLLIRDIEEIDTEECANLLGVTVGVVKTRLHRARQALRTLLDGLFRQGAL